MVGEESHRLGVLQKPSVSEDIGVGEGGDDNVQRLAAVWGLVVGVLHPGDRLVTAVRTMLISLERGLSHRGTFHH